MSPLAEQFAREIRDEVAGKINQRERMFDPEDGFIISKYVPPVKHPRHKKNVDHKRNHGFNNRAGKIKMAGRPAINHFRLRRSIRSKNKKPMHKIEIGDFLMYDGEWQMAFVVFEKQARIVQANGSVTIVNRKLNDIFIKQQLGAAGLDNFLSGNNLKLDELIAKQEAKDDSNMKPKVKAKLEAGKNAAPRGGLAAEVAKRKAAESNGSSPKASRSKKTTPATSEDAKGTPSEILAKSAGRTKGSLGTLFGFSVVRCIAAAGKAGASYEQVVAALKKHDITPKESTAKQNLRLGKTGKIEGAPLSEEQLAEFLS